jgi:hypothetical protein
LDYLRLDQRDPGAEPGARHHVIAANSLLPRPNHQVAGYGMPQSNRAATEDESMLNELVAAAIATPNPKPLFRNAAELAVDMIREAIYSGQIAPGERIKKSTLQKYLGSAGHLFAKHC